MQILYIKLVPLSRSSPDLPDEASLIIMKNILLALALLGNSAIVFADDALQFNSTASTGVNSEKVSRTEPANQEKMNELALYALSLSGTPYKYGGNSPDSGFDCSGFVGYVYRQVLDIDLPRSAREINRQGQAVRRADLQPGDLVFYNTLRRTFSHVGIYLGNNRFVHSPSRGGSIRVDSMLDRYWRKRYQGARRIVPDQQEQAPAGFDDARLTSGQLGN